MDEFFEEEAARRLAEAEAADTPENRARNAAKREAERQRHIAAGWITEDGEPGPNAPKDDEDDADEDESDDDDED